MDGVSNHNSQENNITQNDDVLNTDNKKYIDPECYNDDLEEVISIK